MRLDFVVNYGGELRKREREGRRWLLHLRVSTQWSPVNRHSHEAGSLMTEVGEARLRTWTPSRKGRPRTVHVWADDFTVRQAYSKSLEDNFSFTTSARPKASVNHLNQPALAVTPGEAGYQHCQTSVCVCLLLKPKVTVSALDVYSCDAVGIPLQRHTCLWNLDKGSIDSTDTANYKTHSHKERQTDTHILHCCCCFLLACCM